MVRALAWRHFCSKAQRNVYIHGGAVTEATNLRDAELVSRIKGGDMQSFDTLVEAYFPGTYKRVQMLVPADDAEDVTQDIFLNLMNSIDSFKGRSAFATWFSRIVANKVADYHRKMFRQKNRFASRRIC